MSDPQTMHNHYRGHALARPMILNALRVASITFFLMLVQTESFFLSAQPRNSSTVSSPLGQESDDISLTPASYREPLHSRAARTSTAEAPSHDGDDDARTLVRKLGAREFVIREEATQALWELGPQVESELRRALQSDDRETVARAELILDRFRYGIFPETPLEVVMLIEQYRTGDKNLRSQVLQQLVAQGQIGTVERLVDLAETAAERREVSEWILGRFDQTLAPLVLDNKFDALERILLILADDDEQIAMCTAMLLHRGRLEEGIAKIQSRIELIESLDGAQGDTSRERRLLISFHHAMGNDQAAMELLADVPNAVELTRNFLITSSDWQAWSDWEAAHNREPEQDAAWGLGRLEPLSYAALAHHLAGHDDLRDQMLTQIRTLCEENDAALLFAAECFFAVDQPDEAIELFTQRDPFDGFSLLCQQHRYEEAFATLGMTFEDASIEAWIGSLLKVENLEQQADLTRLYNGLDVCAQLALMGRTELAKRSYSRLAEFALSADIPQPTLLREICRQEFLLEFDDLAWEQMDRLFETARYKNQEVLRNDFGARCLFPQDFVLSTFWWKALALQETDTIACLKQIKQILETHAENEAVPPYFQEALDSALSLISHAEESSRLQEYAMLADTCLRANLKGLAQKYYEEAFRLGHSPSGIDLGDMARKADDFETAANWYAKAYQANPTLTRALYLQGTCLEQAGNVNRGRELKEQARLLSLQPMRALDLADALHLRDLSDEAVAIWESVEASTLPLSSADYHACERLGSVLADTVPARAAAAWQQLLINTMSLNSTWPSATLYLSTCEQIHRMRAYALLEAGEIDAAWKQIELCETLEPGSSEVPEFLVPRLEQAGAKEKADELFNTYFDHYEELLTLLPQSALHHNNLAWFAARCQRRIDEALQHARRAVEIEPTSSNYLDTLAELLFLKGNPQEAAELAKRCIEINPVKAHYREQLVRFQAAMRETPR